MNDQSDHPDLFNKADRLHGRPGAYFDDEGHFIHNCEICGAPAERGQNVNLSKGQLGNWRCEEHAWGKCE